MSAVPSDDSVPNRRLLAAICAVIALLFFVVAVIYAIEPARSLPAALGHRNSGGHHALRMAGSFVIGLVFGAGAWGIMAYKPKPKLDATPTDASSDNTSVGSRSTSD